MVRRSTKDERGAELVQVPGGGSPSGKLKTFCFLIHRGTFIVCTRPYCTVCTLCIQCALYARYVRVCTVKVKHVNSNCGGTFTGTNY